MSETTKIAPEILLGQKRGIDGISTMLGLNAPEALLPGANWLTDLDDTTKELTKYKWTDGKMRRVLPETVAGFGALHRRGVPIGIATEQGVLEIEPWEADVAQLVLGPEAGPYDLFNGIIIGEGGCVARRGARNGKPGEFITLVGKQALEDRATILEWLQANIEPSSELEGWGVLAGTDPRSATFVQLPPDDEQGAASINLFEKGPHISQDPSYIDRYKLLADKVNAELERMGITTIGATEAGNGTMRIRPVRIHKAKTLGLLAATGAFDPTRTVYSCDGPNDEAWATALKIKGGAVVAVGNAIPALHDIADYSAKSHTGLGFAETVRLLLPVEYEASLQSLRDRNLQLAA